MKLKINKNKQLTIYFIIIFCIILLLFMLHSYKLQFEKFNTLYTTTDVSNASFNLINDISNNIKEISDNLDLINTDIDNVL